MTYMNASESGLTHVGGPVARRRPRARTAVPAALVAAIAIGVAGTVVVAAIAHAAGVSQSFTPLKTGSYVGLIILGVLAGGASWQMVRTRAGDPERVLRRLVPLVVLVSFVPDVVIGVTGADHATWGGVAALMCAHVVVACAAVVSFSLFLPVTSRSR